MSTPTRYNVVEFVLADALKLYLEASFESVLPVFHQSEVNDIKYPCVFITDGSAAEYPEGTATYNVDIGVGVASQVGAKRELHTDYVGQLTDLIFNEDFITTLNAGLVPGLLVQRVQKTTRQTQTDSAMRRTTQMMTVMCAMCAT